MRFITKSKQLGDFVLNPYRFENLDTVMQEIRGGGYAQLNHKQKSAKINGALLRLIQQAPFGFLLIAVLEFVDRINREGLLEQYTLTGFELWLNQFSGLSDGENLDVRGKIVGKDVPRDTYQLLFPIGMGKVHPGSHFVTAHASPDLDTTVASFWGWIDAFGARVSEGLHIWNVPGGPPPSSIEVALLFQHIFGQGVFDQLAKTRESLALSSLELMTQRGVLKQKTDQSSFSIDHERTQKAVVLVDDEGYYLGDWRNFDVEGVRQVIMLLNNCLRWFENNFHSKIVSLFAKEHLTLDDLPQFINEVLEIKISECVPAKEFSAKHGRYMDGYLSKVLGVSKGMGATFAEFAEAMKAQKVEQFQECIDRVEGLATSHLFDENGILVENRPKILHHLEEIIAVLDQAIYNARLYTERLEVALNIKTKVFGYLPQVVSYRADVDELRSKMGNYPYLTVTSSDEEGRMLPLGVVRSRDLHQDVLGTVTVRDFCNRDETKIPSYFEVISVIDHHKVALNTSSAPVIHISDAQSSNAMVAELAFMINDRYSLGGMKAAAIHKQLEKAKDDVNTPRGRRILKRLLDRLQAADKASHHKIDPLREFVEYLHFLYAILDDTDLLTKVSRRDVECVGQLLNRLKSLMIGEEIETISFDDIPHGATYVQSCASRILQHPDMYSIYRKIYVAKEQLVEENLTICIEGKPSSIFVDTKLQNGCCRVGQTKMFANNYTTFIKHADAIRRVWVAQSSDFFKDRREFGLYLHMISTIAGAEDLYKGVDGAYRHNDELWIWIPMTEPSIEHLKIFLDAFRASPQILGSRKNLELECIGPLAGELKKIFRESFLSLPCIVHADKGGGESLAILRYPAGTINSRKAMISPYLPKPIA